MSFTKRRFIILLVCIILSFTSIFFNTAWVSAEAVISKAGKTIERLYFFENNPVVTSVVWDGSKYISVGGFGYFTSKDGRKWSYKTLDIYNPSDIALNNGVYTITGAQYFDDVGVAASKNGTDWRLVSGIMPKDNVIATPLESKLIWFKGKLYLFGSTGLNSDYSSYDRVMVSEDGAGFEKRLINVTDPRGLAPGGFKFLGSNGTMDTASVISDGSFLYAIGSHFMDRGRWILRSADGINWEIVYYDKAKSIGGYLQLHMFKGKYFVLGYSDMMYSSGDGENWAMEPSCLADFNIKGADGRLVPPAVSLYNDYMILQPYKVKNSENIHNDKLYITKDMKSFTEYSIKEGAQSIQYVDSKLLITTDSVYDASIIKEFAPAVPGAQGGAASGGSQPSAGAKSALPTASKVMVDGQLISFEAYNIDNNNYFKLRDIAKVISGTGKQFDVGWNSAAKVIELTSGKSYTAIGGELAVSTELKNVQASVNASKILIDGKEVQLTAYSINNNNYFKLRDLGSQFNFSVSWDGVSKTISIDTSKAYTE